jgi:hypothetical protein
MRSWLLSLVLGATIFGWTAVTPSTANAQFFARWRPVPYMSSYYYTYPYYGYVPYSYGYPVYSYGYYATPAYTTYYYGPYTTSYYYPGYYYYRY